MIRYKTIWNNADIAVEAKSIDDFIEIFECLTEMFKEWKDAGIELDLDSDIENDAAVFYTTDPEVAEWYDFEESDDQLALWDDENIN